MDRTAAVHTHPSHCHGLPTSGQGLAAAAALCGLLVPLLQAAAVGCSPAPHLPRGAPAAAVQGGARGKTGICSSTASPDEVAGQRTHAHTHTHAVHRAHPPPTIPQTRCTHPYHPALCVNWPWTAHTQRQKELAITPPATRQHPQRQLCVCWPDMHTLTHT